MLEKAQGPVTQRASVTEHCLVREELRPYNRSHDTNIPPALKQEVTSLRSQLGGDRV